MNASWALDLPFHRYCWHNYYENKMLADIQRPLIAHPESIRITGTPVMDDLLALHEVLNDPWKCCNRKKRIIYSPHHTIGNMHPDGIAYSTFLENCDFLLEMAQKYKDLIHIAFKPHPLLRNNLNKYWGVEKTSKYYSKWLELENAQIEDGTYMGLFKYSDAMIHDCASFMVEYLYTEKPVLFLMREDNTDDCRSRFLNECKALHYIAWNHNEIERFITDVINSKDNMAEKRRIFKKVNLLPPNNKLACENIINAILCQDEYA